jgi:phosphonate transport system ATP-binding protein
MIFQQFNLVNRLDVLTNVLIGRLAHHSTLPTLFKHFSRAEKVMAIKALQRLDMASHALQRADTLSGGQQQRVAIAKALVQEPEVVLADECVASLDPPNAAKVMSALKAINEEDGITIICNLHHLNTARTHCQRIIGMSNGRIVFDGTPESLTMSKLQEIYGAADESDDLQTDIGFSAGGEHLPITGAAAASA